MPLPSELPLDSAKTHFSRSQIWNRATERRYQDWLAERGLPFAQRVYPFLIVVILAFGAWDYLLAPKAIFTTWPLRLVAAAGLGVLIILLHVPQIARFWRLVTLGFNQLLFGILLLIFVQFPEGPLWGAPGLLLSPILFRVHSPLLAALSTLANTALLVAIYTHFGVPLSVVINSLVFLLCASAANILVNHCDNLRDREVFALASKLETLATTDPLTGAVNRRVFSERLESEIERAQRYGVPLSLVLIDIDFFKKVNDTRGHGDGDLALQSVAKLGLQSLRGTDLFARLGGEEFVILMPHADLEAACRLAERLRERIALNSVNGESGLFQVTASLGVAQYTNHESDNAFLARADTALYQAKAAGRNRVVCAEKQMNALSQTR